LGVGSAVALTAVAAWLIVRASLMPPVLTLTVASVAVRMFGVSRPVMRYVERLASHRIALDGMAHIRAEIYRIISSGNVHSVSSIRRGDLLARTSTDVEEFANVVVLALLPGAVAFGVSVGVVVFFAFLSPAIAAVMALCQLLAGILVPLFTMRGAQIAEVERQQVATDLSADLLTVLDHATELQVSGRLASLRQRITEHETRLAAHSDRAAVPTAFGQSLSTAFMLVAVLGAILIGIPQLHAGALSVEELGVLVLTPLAAFEATAQLGPAAVQLVRSAAAARRITALLDAAGPSQEHSSTPPATSATAAPQLELRDVTLAWPGHRPVATGINLTLPPGRAIAVVGASGIGKTTLLATAAGYIPPARGQVLIDGTPAQRSELAHLVSVTEEDAHIFHTTVLENLRVANGQLSEAEGHELLERAGLGSWLRALPDGLDTMLGSHGHTISGGERRRLLFARALGATAPIMLLDEAAEHLDTATADQLLADAIREVHATNRSLMVVTHRLSALTDIDEVMMLGTPADASEATIVARGRHHDLLASDRHYRWSVQQEEDDDGYDRA
ncbi:MAG: thiol reductant ABC exporter subunit CydC, partial [Bowdeniella nasicola]|nr:thiol reductant ABC exporter subunit CydC [Bowdeniella nasicola]